MRWDTDGQGQEAKQDRQDFQDQKGSMDKR